MIVSFEDPGNEDLFLLASDAFGHKKGFSPCQMQTMHQDQGQFHSPSQR